MLGFFTGHIISLVTSNYIDINDKNYFFNYKFIITKNKLNKIENNKNNNLINEEKGKKKDDINTNLNKNNNHNYKNDNDKNNTNDKNK